MFVGPSQRFCARGAERMGHKSQCRSPGFASGWRACGLACAVGRALAGVPCAHVRAHGCGRASLFGALGMCQALSCLLSVPHTSPPLHPQTGSTFGGAAAYIERRQPAFVFLENVASIGDGDRLSGVSNADQIESVLASLGYIMLSRVCDAREHGACQRRTRWWAVGVRVSFEPLLHNSDFESHKMAMAKFDEAIEVVRIEPFPLESILMQDQEELEVWQRMRRPATDLDLTSQQEQEDEDAVSCKWPLLHVEHFRAHSVRHPPTYALLYDEKELKQLQSLPPRCREVVFFFDSLHGRTSEEEVIDISCSINRVPRCVGAMPCCTPKGMFWLRKKFRLIEPNECLQAQGIRLRARHEVSAFSPAELQALAGNAFNAYTALAVTIAALSSFAFP